MQYKKDEVIKRLVEAGEEEFFNYGFKGSSVRRIAGNAGTTIGNFYNYFRNKEALFHEVVKGELGRFNDFLNGHEDTDEADFLWDINDAAVWYKVLDDTADIFMPVFTRKFYILTACSEGTTLGNSRTKVLEYIKKHFIEHIHEQNAVMSEAEETSHIMAFEFLEGILYTIRNHYGTDAFENLIKNQLMFFLMGTMGMLKGLGEDTAHD